MVNFSFSISIIDHNFECDPDLHDWLRDDEKYTLVPKSRNRMSRVAMKDRPDCDLLMRRCLRCNTLYSCVKTLLNHMSYQHSDKKAFFPCIYCRNVYSQVNFHPSGFTLSELQMLLAVILCA